MSVCLFVFPDVLQCLWCCWRSSCGSVLSWNVHSSSKFKSMYFIFSKQDCVINADTSAVVDPERKVKLNGL